MITGNTDFFTKESLQYLSGEHTVVAAGGREHGTQEESGGVFHADMEELESGRLFDQYHFQAVWYVSGFVDGGARRSMEERWVDRLMWECRRAKVERVLILAAAESRNYLVRYGKDGTPAYKDYLGADALYAAREEDICDHYAKKYGVETVKLWLPYVARRLNEDNFLGKIFWDMYSKKRVSLPYRAKDRIDFITLKELAGLLLRVSGDAKGGGGRFFVQGGYCYSYGEFAQMLKNVSADVRIVFEDHPDVAVRPQFQPELQCEYGFMPLEDVVENIAYYYRIFLEEAVDEEGSPAAARGIS